GDRRPPRPAGPEGLASHEVVELVARLARLQPGPAQVLGRRGTVLLLRREVIRGQGNNSLRPLIRGSGELLPCPRITGFSFLLEEVLERGTAHALDASVVGEVDGLAGEEGVVLDVDRLEAAHEIGR